MSENELPVRDLTDSEGYDRPPDPRVPLVERRDDILPLARRFVMESREELKTGHKDISREAGDYLMDYNWPGDEAELEIAVKRACILSEGGMLEIEDFDLKQRRVRSVGKFIEGRLKGFMRNIKTLERFNLYDMVIPEVERALILMVMKETAGNQVRASRLLGINRNTLRTKIKKLGIDADN